MLFTKKDVIRILFEQQIRSTSSLVIESPAQIQIRSCSFAQMRTKKQGQLQIVC